MTLWLWVGLLGAAPELLCYLPFDGGPAAAVAAGEVEAAALASEPGWTGEAIRLTGELRLPAAGNWSPEAGTCAAWLCLREAGAFEAPRYVVSLYGADDRPEPWRHNRFSLYFAAGRLRWTVWGADGQAREVSAPVADWQAGSWHHVSATWAGATGDRATLALFLDGMKVAEATGLPLRLGSVGSRLNLGRDGDASPDYLDGLLDEVYIYNGPLPDEVIANAARRPAGEAGVATASTEGEARPDWWRTGWPYRVAVTVPAAESERSEPVVELPLAFVTAAGRLTGRPAALEPGSCRLVVAGRVVPTEVAEGRVRWRLPGHLPAGETARADLYFRLREYDLTVPLQARAAPATPAASGAVPLPDYATETFGEPWDFSRPDFAGLDRFGDKPEYIQAAQVDGALRLEVKQDPYFIWGTMWGNAPPRRPIDIDLERYRLLEIRLKQSVASAQWSLYGRLKGADTLLQHHFTVTGTEWQTIRLDLLREARWGGRITAFRIDPTNLVEATVEIRYVRLLAVSTALVGEVETLGWPSAPVSRLTLQAPTEAVAGSRHQALIEVTDAAGRPVSGQPVTVRLAPGSGGRLSAGDQPSDGSATYRRGLTDAAGRLRVVYEASQKAGAAADRWLAGVDFSPVGPVARAVDIRPGPPARLTVSPARATWLPRGERQCRITAQVADSFGNPVAAAGRRVTLTGPEGASLVPATGLTDATGALTAALTLDPDRLWVAWLEALDEAGLTGRSAAVCYTSDRRDWGVTVGDNGYFVTPAGRAWLPLGGFYANWVGDVPATGEPGRKLTSFVDTTDAEKIAWLKFLAEQGVTALRFMLRAHRPGGMEPLDIGGRVNPELYAEALHYMDLARPFGIRFLLVLHEDYSKPLYVNADHLERFCLPRWADTDLDALPAHQRRFLRERRVLTTAGQRYTDPDARACQEQYAREIVGLLRDNPQVFAYELENEQVAVPPEWVERQCAVIREVDPRTPICMSHGGGGLRTADPLFWRQSAIDFYTYHLYPDHTVADETDYGLAVAVLCRYGRLAGRSFLGESVGDEWGYGAPEAMRRLVARDVVWFSLVEGNPGVMFWNQRGWEVEEFRLARRLTRDIDFATWRRAPAPTQVIIDHPLANDGWFRTPAGGEALRQLSRYTRHYLQLGADFDFVRAPTPGADLAPLATFAPPPARRRPVQPTAGFEAATLARADDSEGLTYVRNCAASELWQAADARRSRQLVRTIAPRPATLTFALGPGPLQVTVADLTTGEVTQRAVAGDGRLELGVTDHDFALHWRR